MIKNYFKICAAAALLLVGAASCSVDENFSDAQHSEAHGKVSIVTDGAVSGELLVRFDPRVSQILDEAGLVT